MLENIFIFKQAIEEKLVFFKAVYTKVLKKPHQILKIKKCIHELNQINYHGILFNV